MKYLYNRSVSAKARVSAILCVLLFVGSLAFAQEATIVGTVTDPSGSVLPNVNITITSTDTGKVSNINTNGAGQYVAPDLKIGHYTVKAEISGFNTVIRNDVVLNVGDRSRIDFAMKVGQVSEKVTVEANPVAVQSDTGEVSTVITGQQVTQLATNGRSVYTLFALTPGASSVQGDFMTPTPVSGDSNVSINGQRAGHNLQLLDGGENLDRGGSSASVMPSLDAIAEFRNITSNYSAEYGLTSAATITQVVKSGSNQFHALHGSFYGTMLSMRATTSTQLRSRFLSYGSKFTASTWGARFLSWNRHPTFFFYNMEWRRSDSRWPTESNGSLDQFATAEIWIARQLAVPTAAQLAPAQQARFLGRWSCTLGAPFPNNTIPTNLLDPTRRRYRGRYLPSPTNGAQFQGGNNSPTNVREEIVRIDHRSMISFRFMDTGLRTRFRKPTARRNGAPTTCQQSVTYSDNPSYSAVVHATYVISPTLLNEVAFNYNGNRIHIIPQGVVSAPSDFTFNRLFTGPNIDDRIPSINLNGSTGTNYTSNWTPWNQQSG